MCAECTIANLRSEASKAQAELEAAKQERDFYRARMEAVALLPDHAAALAQLSTVSAELAQERETSAGLRRGHELLSNKYGEMLQGLAQEKERGGQAGGGGG